MAVFARTVFAVLRAKMLTVSKIGKRIFAFVNAKYYTTTLTTVTTVRTTVSNVLFGIERSTSVTAVTSLDKNFNLYLDQWLSFILS